MTFSTLTLRPGRFYLSRDGTAWCCYRVDPEAEPHCQARCIQVFSDDRSEYFYLDGRYDAEGQREHTLVLEVSSPT